jgi:hypothetical protein
MAADNIPPNNPDQVLLGLIDGINFGPPIFLPIKNAKISVDHTTKKSQRIISLSIYLNSNID